MEERKMDSADVALCTFLLMVSFALVFFIGRLSGLEPSPPQGQQEQCSP